MRKIVKPFYYDSFRCTAGGCTFTCCRDWEIAVDELTLRKWKSRKIESRKHVMPGRGGGFIRLDREKKCPFLQRDGLCRLVVRYGEDMISHTCHVFPREEHIFSDRTEYTLTMGCPAALDLLWSKDSFPLPGTGEVTQKKEYFPASGTDTLSQAGDPYENVCAPADPALLLMRDHFCRMLQDPDLTPEETLRIAFYTALEIYREQDDLTADQVRKNLSPQSLQKIQNAMKDIRRDEYEHLTEQNELFLDLAESYRQKHMYAGILEPLAWLAESYEEESRADEFRADRRAFEPVWSSHDRQIRLLMAEEIYSTLYLPGGNLYSALQKLEWLGILYALLQQIHFLAWKKDGVLKEETFRRNTALLIRMTGYSEDDLEEYLADHFENVIWDWSYMALIL